MREYALEVHGLYKYFGPVKANDGVTLSVLNGTIHAIVVENGAGKTTFVRCLFGHQRPDRGEIRLWGKPVQFSSPQEALANGIGMVHQHFMLVDALSVWENIVLGAEQGKGGWLSIAACKRAVEKISSDFKLDVDLGVAIGDLSVGIQQRVEILKVLYRGARLVILDEPTAVLTPQESRQLFEVLRGLREKGCTIILITHKLAEVLNVADDVTVMRDGRSIGTWPVSDVTEKMLAHEMVGHDVVLEVTKEPLACGNPIVEIERLSVESAQGDQGLQDTSLVIHAGEILGVAGVAGNGQDALVEGILGLRRITHGNVRLFGREIVGMSTRQIRALGVACIPADRLRMGLVSDLSVRENVLLGFEHQEAMRRGPVLNDGAVTERARHVVHEFNVKTSSLDIPVVHLSGGNQQKLIIGRELDNGPRFLVAVQPTRGVDIGAIKFIDEVLLTCRRNHDAVLLVSNELEEILSLADTIMVLFRGQPIGFGPVAMFSRDDIGLMMAGHVPEDVP